MYDHLIKRAFVIKPTIADPDQIIARLISEGDTRSNTRVNEKVVIRPLNLQRQID